MKKYLKLLYLIGTLAGTLPSYGWFWMDQPSQTRYSETQKAEIKSQKNYAALVASEADTAQKSEFLLQVVRMMAATPTGQNLLNTLLEHDGMIFSETPTVKDAAGEALLSQQKISIDVQRNSQGYSPETRTLWTLAHEAEHMNHLNNAQKKDMLYVKGKYNNLVLVTLREALAERKAAQVLTECLLQQPVDHSERKVFEKTLSAADITPSDFPDFVFQLRMGCVPVRYRYHGDVPKYQEYEEQALNEAKENRGIKSPNWDDVVSVLSGGEITQLKYFPGAQNPDLRADMLATDNPDIIHRSLEGNIPILFNIYVPQNLQLLSQKDGKVKIEKRRVFEDTEDHYLAGYQNGTTEISVREMFDILAHYVDESLLSCKDSGLRSKILSDQKLIAAYQKYLGSDAVYKKAIHQREQNRILSELTDAICVTPKRKELKLRIVFDDNANITGFKQASSGEELTPLDAAQLIIQSLEKEIEGNNADKAYLQSQKHLLEGLKENYINSAPSQLLAALSQELSSTSKDSSHQNIVSILSNHSEKKEMKTPNTAQNIFSKIREGNSQ